MRTRIFRVLMLLLISLIITGNTSANNSSSSDPLIECYDRAIGLDPNFAWAWNDKGKTLKALHRDADAEAAFSRAKQLGYQ